MTPEEQAKRLLEMLDENDWLHNAVHERVRQSPEEADLLRRAQVCNVPVRVFQLVYQRHATDIIEEICEIAKYVLIGA